MMHPNIKDLTGQRFGRLLVLSYSHSVLRQGAFWLCRCDCGTEKVIRGTQLKQGNHARSCGCWHDKFPLTHGMCYTTEYHVWHGIRQRCYNPNQPSYRFYGGRGIHVCKRWRESFTDFLSDMGPYPGKGYSIERLDNDGPYSPRNCVWADRSQQRRNQRRGQVTYQGETLPLIEWSERTGIGGRVLSYRLKAGWPVERALTQPVRRKRK